MSIDRNRYDVSETIDVTDPSAVNAEVNRIFEALYPDASSTQIDRAFRDLDNLYRGRYPGYQACDTAYHDIQHVLDVTLAMARLMEGYECAKLGPEPIGESLFRLGIITALFHDCGYLRTIDDTVHRSGGELTLTHVSRGARFLQKYLPQIGMGEMADFAAVLIHFTGYEIPVVQLHVPSLRHKLLGSLLGTADIIAQMSDRCYLEKCRDRLYGEFVAGGIARKQLPDGKEDVVFESGIDLVRKTPKFYEGAMQRLEEDLGGCYHYAEYHFGGQNLYSIRMEKNVKFAQAFSQKQDTAALKRKLLPSTSLPVN